MKRLIFVMLICLLWTTSGGAAPPPWPKLLFVKQSPAGCTINVWDPQSAETLSTQTLSVCPSHVFGIPEKNLILVTTRDSIQEFELFPLQEKGAPLRLPTPPVKPKMSAPELYAAGLTPGDLVTLNMYSLGPGDEPDIFIYVWRNGDWALEKTVHCRRVGPCDMPTIRSDRDNLWPPRHAVWDPSQRKNPFVVDKSERIEEDPHTKSPTTVGWLAFSFQGSRSVLTFRTIDGDLGGTVTLAVELQLKGEPPQVLSKEPLWSAGGKLDNVSRSQLEHKPAG